MAAEGFTQGSVAITDIAGLSEVLADLQGQIDDIDGGGGGGGAPPVAVVAGRVTSGNITPQNTSSAVQPLTGGPTFAIAAAVGDRIRVDVVYLTDPRSATFYDLAVMVSGSAVRYCTTGTSTPPVEGDPGMYPSTSFQGRPGPFSFTVESGDLSGGLVTIGFVVESAGAGSLFASESFPLRYTLTNYGQAS